MLFCLFLSSKTPPGEFIIFDKVGEDCAFKLLYCSTVWSSTSKRNVRKLQLVQNNACRIVAGLTEKYDHVSEALKSLKWLNVRNKLLFFNDLVMVFKINA